MNNYPLGAEFDSNAPWNKETNPEREVEVLISITMSKTVKVKVSDYQITDSGIDEDGDYFEDIDYSECNLKGVVMTQIPHIKPYWEYNNIKMTNEERIDRDLEGYHVDDFEVILENNKI